MSREDPDVIDSVAKAFAVLEAFSEDHPTLTVSEAAALAGVTRPTARRILLTFARLGLAEESGRGYALTAHVLRFGHGYLSSLPVSDRAAPRMRALADRVRESCSNGDARRRRDRLRRARAGGAHHVDHARHRLAAAGLSDIDGPRAARRAGAGAARRLLRARTAGAADGEDDHGSGELRAELERVRAQGFAVVDGEREEGVRSAAAPVRDTSGAVVAALNVSANAARVSLERLRDECVPLLVETAEAISRDIGYRPARRAGS